MIGRAGNPASSWLTAVVALGLAQILSYGRFEPHALILALLGVGAGMWAALGGARGSGSYSTAALVAGVEALLLAALVHPPLTYCTSQGWLRAYSLGLLTSVLLVGTYLFPLGGRWRWAGPLRFGVLIGFSVALRLSVPLASPSPGEDVWWVQQEAAAGVLAGRDPYAISYSQIFSPEVYRAFGYRSGFHYPPLSLLPILPAWLLMRDVRWAYVLCELLLLAAAWRLAGRGPGTERANRELLVGLWGLSSPVLLVLEHGWTEPLGLALLALAMLLFRSGRRTSAALSLAAFFSYKQYTLLLFPLLLFLPQAGALLAGFATLTALTYAPWWFLGFRGLADSLVEPWRAFPRPDGLSLAALWLQIRQAAPPGWLSPLFLLAAMHATLSRVPRHAAGLAAALFVVLAVLFLTAKQSFVNYYYFLGYLALLSCALSGTAAPAGAERAEAPGP